MRWLTVLFQELPTYNDKRRGTISAATLRNLQRSRSNPQLNVLFQSNTANPAHSTDTLAGHRTDTSPVRAAASLSSAHQYHSVGLAARGRQHTDPIRSSILLNSGKTTIVNDMRQLYRAKQVLFSVCLFVCVCLPVHTKTVNSIWIYRMLWFFYGEP